MFRSTLFALFMYTIPGLIWAQSEIDSLRSVYVTADDSSKVLVGLQIIEKDSSYYSYNELLRSAQNQSSSYLTGKVYQSIGTNFEEKYAYDSALSNYNKAIEMFSDGNYKSEEATTHYWKAGIYYTLDKKDDVTASCFEALDLFKQANDSLGQAKALNLIGNANNYWGYHDIADRYYQEALDIYEGQDHKRGQAVIHFNRAGMYSEDGLVEKSKDTYQKTLELVKVLGEQDFIADTYMNFGLLYIESDLAKAEQLINQGYQIHKQINHEEGLLFAYQHLCRIYNLKKQYALADEYCQKAIGLADKMTFLQVMINARTYQYERLEQQGNYKRAYKYFSEVVDLEDSIRTTQSMRDIQELNAKYETEKKQSQNELLLKEKEIHESNLARQQQIILVISIASFALVISLLFLIRSRKQRTKLIAELNQQKQKAEKDKQTIEEQSVRLKETDAAKSRFFANVSHDLRTPLTLIMGSFEKISADQDSYLTTETENQLSTGQKNCERLLHLVNEINDLNLLEDGKLRLNKQPIDLEKFLNLLVGMFGSAAEINGISLEFNRQAKSTIFVNADSNHLERIIYNLIANALKFTESGGKVAVSLSNNDDMARIQVTDTGCGIDDKSLPYIFDRFYQSILNEYSATKEGMGIGLSLVKELVSLHDGEVFAESQLGKGSTFTVELPICETPQGIEQISPILNYDKDQFVPVDLNAPSPIQTNFSKSEVDFDHTILIVEDHADIRDYIISSIRETYNVKWASNGKSALDILKNHAIDLVISDLMMPWMDGFELLENIKSDDLLKNTPVMIVSARTSEEDRARVLNLGVNDFLIKPFRRDELLSRIRNLIQNQDGKSDLLVVGEDNFHEIEKNILQSVEELILKNIANSKLSVLDLADKMAASERQVYRMIKKLSGMTPYEYIKEVRLLYVEHLLKKGAVRSVAEASSKIGMKNSTAFKRQFTQRFHKDPSEYLA